MGIIQKQKYIYQKFLFDRSLFYFEVFVGRDQGEIKKIFSQIKIEKINQQIQNFDNIEEQRNLILSLIYLKKYQSFKQRGRIQFLFISNNIYHPQFLLPSQQNL
ncbi:hypothetical protein ABPG72_002784 [Tetrahymena utriculariae]